MIPEETIYWDWTMDDSRKEVLPAKLARVSSAALDAPGRIGPAAFPQREQVRRSGGPHARRVAIDVMNRAPMAFAARRVEALARAELAKPDCAGLEEAADTARKSRSTADPTAAAAAVALIGDAVADVAPAALELSYNAWVSLLTHDQQREAGAASRTALVTRFRDPEPRIPPTGVAPPTNHYVASRDIEPAVRRLAQHPDPAVRQQVGNVLGVNDFSGLPPAGRGTRKKYTQ